MTIKVLVRQPATGQDDLIRNKIIATSRLHGKFGFSFISISSLTNNAPSIYPQRRPHSVQK